MGQESHHSQMITSKSLIFMMQHLRKAEENVSAGDTKIEIMMYIFWRKII